jgi:hypothetical protein
LLHAEEFFGLPQICRDLDCLQYPTFGIMPISHEECCNSIVTAEFAERL